jgi:quercetin dioxygenase-like cupin family protein
MIVDEKTGIRVLNIEDGVPFNMGKAVSKKILYPEMGAKQLTLNYGVHQPGMEFKQHIHAVSEDVIVCLKGSGVIRSGDTRIAFSAGDVVYVPAGVVHGTINTGDSELVMFSCQAPPDAALYSQPAER